MKITLALTHFERFELLQEAIAEVQHDKRIEEIVISDDCSQDGSYERMESWKAGNDKVRVGRNKANRDCYANKARAVAMADRPWVILFDSDNILPVSYLDTIFALPEWREDTIYAPEYAWPHFDYRKYSGLIINRHNVAEFMGDAVFRTALNTANYFVHAESYMDAWDPHTNPVTSDSIYMAYRWLERGGEIQITPGLQYFHRVHDGSHYKKNHHRTGSFGPVVEKKLKSLV